MTLPVRSRHPPRYTLPMIALTSKQRRELRAQAHALHPVVSVGQHGLTPQVMHEIDVALRAHGLVKVRVFSEDRAQRETMLAQIADELDAAPVQHLGKVLILWRPLEEKPAKPAARPAKKKPKERARAGSKRPATERMTREARVPHSAGRRARGAASAADDRTGPDSRRRPRHGDDQALRARRGSANAGSAASTFVVAANGPRTDGQVRSESAAAPARRLTLRRRHSP